VRVLSLGATSSRFPGALWHVTNRGVEQRAIYADDRDRSRFLQLALTVGASVELLAFVLMTRGTLLPLALSRSLGAPFAPR
jgi:hypothetical protein